MKTLYSIAQLNSLVHTFNKAYKVGDIVEVYKSICCKEVFIDEIKSSATILSGHTPITWLKNAGSYDLTFVRGIRNFNNHLLSKLSRRPKKFLKMFSPYDKWDEVVEDFCDIDCVINCETVKKIHDWNEYSFYDFLLLVRTKEFDSHKSTIDEYSIKYQCNIAVLGHYEMETQMGIVEVEKIYYQSINRPLA